MTETWTDARASAGPRDVFSVDITVATGRCAGCGNTGPLAEGRIFSHSPGLVLRCPACGEALLRLTRAPAAPGSTCAAWNTSNWRHPNRRWPGFIPTQGWTRAIAAWWRDASRTVRRRPDGLAWVALR
jgi:hypothetical protein